MTKFKLPKTKKKKWVKALRSGEYEQGQGSLKATDFDMRLGQYKNVYCCLGVAREVGLCKTKRAAMLERSGCFVATTFLPVEIQNLLAAKNDNYNWSFKRIATWIEKNL